MLIPIVTIECATQFKYSQIHDNCLKRYIDSGWGGEFSDGFGWQNLQIRTD